MTKLLEWLSGIAILFSIWLYLIMSKDHNEFSRTNWDLILYSPIIFVLLFGLYAASVILYRVFTFNDCEAAANELQKEIQEAKEQLTGLGFKFTGSTK